MTAIAQETQRDWGALVEALGVFLLIMIYIWWVRLSHPWFAVAVLGLVIGSHLMRAEGLRWLGFAWWNARRAFPAVMPWVAGAAVSIVFFGVILGTVRQTTITQAMLSIFAYTVWGLFQQYLLNGYFVNRLEEFAGKGRQSPVALAAACLFALAHLPNWFLMPVTFVGGYLCARVYLRYRSLYVLAAAHGIIGFCVFLIVPDSISAHFLVGPRYLLEMYGTYPEFLL